MARFYYARYGQRHGPVTEEKLKVMAASGELRPDEMVLQEGTTQWLAASQVGSLSFANGDADSSRSGSASMQGTSMKFSWLAFSLVILLLASNVVLLFILLSGGSSAGPDRSVPAAIKPGVRVHLWTSNYTEMFGVREVLEVRGNWVLMRIDPDGDSWDAWVNFDTVSQCYMVK